MPDLAQLLLRVEGSVPPAQFEPAFQCAATAPARIAHHPTRGANLSCQLSSRSNDRNAVDDSLYFGAGPGRAMLLLECRDVVAQEVNAHIRTCDQLLYPGAK